MRLEELGLQKKVSEQLRKEGIENADQLYLSVPNKYVKMEDILHPEFDDIGKIVRFYAKVLSIKKYDNGRVPYMQMVVTTGKKEIAVSWFHSNYLYKTIADYKYVAIVGILAENKWGYTIPYSITNPVHIFGITAHDLCAYPNTKNAKDLLQKLNPILTQKGGFEISYKKIKGLANERRNALSLKTLHMFPAKDKLPIQLQKQLETIALNDALRILHAPETKEEIDAAIRRIRLNGLTYFAYCVNEMKNFHTVKIQCPVRTSGLKYTPDFLKNLPYKLTNGQKETVRAILSDMQNEQCINALVQGDVGCGKTMVAVLAALVMAENGYQAVIMAPTAILAKQHYDQISGICKRYGILCTYLSSGQKAVEKREKLKEIAENTSGIIIGTHAVFGKQVVFKNLKLAVIDEEHKFGVEQRERLSGKSGEPIHTIYMSATPIPRTLANVVYSEYMDIYSIHEMPKGRQPVETIECNTDSALIQKVKEVLKEGHQCYVVCAMIDSDEDSEITKQIRSVAETEKLFAKELTGYCVESVTGKTSKKKAEEVIGRFEKNHTQVLVSTTVIEVGVNVPNATCIVIQNAERYGLSQIHQLRGRVGRGGGKSYCLLDSRNAKEKAKERIRILCNTSDGFAILEQDMANRGTGDILGTEQSGTDILLNYAMMYPEEYKKIKEFIRSDKTDQLADFAEWYEEQNYFPKVEKIKVKGIC